MFVGLETGGKKAIDQCWKDENIGKVFIIVTLHVKCHKMCIKNHGLYDNVAPFWRRLLFKTQ